MDTVEQQPAGYYFQSSSASAFVTTKCDLTFVVVDSVAGSPAFSKDVVRLRSGGRNKDAPSPSLV